MIRPIIQLKNVSKSFGSQKILDDVDLTIKRGKTTIIAGGSGQGKSVTLKLILGLLVADSGQILVDGKDITCMSRRQLNQIRSRFGVLFQGAALLDSMTLFDNVALPLQERTKLNRKEIRTQVLTTLDELNLLGHEDKFPAQLSGGMKKRAGLARALQLRPDVMLFDEPTTGLDPEKAMEIYRLFEKIKKMFNYTSIIVSHDIPKVFNLADQVVLLHEGRMNIFDSPEDIQKSDIPYIKEFVRSTMGEVYSSSEME